VSHLVLLQLRATLSDLSKRGGQAGSQRSPTRSSIACEDFGVDESLIRIYKTSDGVERGVPVDRQRTSGQPGQTDVAPVCSFAPPSLVLNTPPLLAPA